MPSILVPLDFSDCAPKLLDEAIRFARAFRAPLLLLHVSEPPRGLPLDAVVKPHGAREPATVAALLRADAEKELAPMLRAARAQGIEAEGRVAFGPIAGVILDVASRDRVAMIVMGTHGRTGLLRAALGSIAEEVLRRAEVPVVTVRTRHHAGCEASRCATCALGKSDVERALGAEDAG
jgi:nucleotide-binding universal stress UspA family protein